MRNEQGEEKKSKRRSKPSMRNTCKNSRKTSAPEKQLENKNSKINLKSVVRPAKAGSTKMMIRKTMAKMVQMLRKTKTSRKS